jgi:ABC-type Na+ efflux pump permease subunit
VRFVLTAAAKDIRRRLADPAALAFWIGIPLVLAGMLSFISNTGGEALRAKVVLVDLDNTAISGLLPAAARQGNMPIDIETVSMEEGRRRIADGEATALLVIPAGFQNAVLGTGSATLELVTNPAQRLLPGIVQQSMEVLVEATFYGQRLFGDQIRQVAGQTTQGPPVNVAAIAVAVNQQIEALQGVLLPPVISLTVKSEQPQASLNFGQLFLPGMLFMSFLFIAQGMSFDVWEEKREGTLRRLLTTPQSAGRFLFGKLLASLGVTTVVAVVGLLGAMLWFDLAWTRIPAALLWCAFVSGALVALITLLNLFAGTQRGAEMLSGIVTFPLMMLGGSFFPFEAMPAWMAAIGVWTPNGLGVARLKELLYGDVSSAALAMAAVGIGIPAALAFLGSWRRLRRFANA